MCISLAVSVFIRSITISRWPHVIVFLRLRYSVVFLSIIPLLVIRTLCICGYCFLLGSGASWYGQVCVALWYHHRVPTLPPIFKLGWENLPLIVPNPAINYRFLSKSTSGGQSRPMTIFHDRISSNLVHLLFKLSNYKFNFHFQIDAYCHLNIYILQINY